MEITITRTNKNQRVIEGFLEINGERICDTAECPMSAVPAGVYQLHLYRCKQHHRRVLSLLKEPPPCSFCPQMQDVSCNSVMPCECPMLTIGNGVRGRKDGSIILGEKLVEGTLMHSAATYYPVYNRIRQSLWRGTPVQLVIR